MKKQTRKQFFRTIVSLCLYGTGILSSFLSFKCMNDKNNQDKSDNEFMANINTNSPSYKNNPKFESGYLKLHRSGELNKRAKKLWNIMKECSLCPRECGVDRISGDVGFCEASAQLEIASFHPHFGEERPLVGSGGSGTIFFTNCGLRCVFCINWEISQGGDGTVRSFDYLAHMMLRLQKN